LIKLYLFLSYFVVSVCSFSFNVDVPKYENHVVDLAKILLPQQELQLAEIIKNIYQNGEGFQFAILTTTSLKGTDIATYSHQVAESWQIGNETSDDGVLIVVAPNERKIRIEVGEGLEGFIPDSIAARIIDFGIKPHFKKADYYSGLATGINLINDQIQGKENNIISQKLSFDDYLPIIIFIIFFLIVISRSKRRNRGDHKNWKGGQDGGFFGDSFPSGREFDFGSGGGSSFGGGGGGFSGGGGGGFSGGGASGSW